MIKAEKVEKKKAEEGEKMQIDQGEDKQDNDVLVTLREIASRIFSTAFKEKLKFLQDTFLTDDSKHSISDSNK